MRIRFHVHGVFAQFADVNVKGREVGCKSHRDHGEIRLAVMNCSQRGNACLADETCKGLF